MLMQGKHVESYHNMVCPVRMTHSCCVCEGGKMEKEALFSVVFPLPWQCGGRALFVFLGLCSAQGSVSSGADKIDCKASY